MTSTTMPDYVPGESFEEHLRRHGCVLREDEWDAVVSHHGIADTRDPEYVAAGIHDAHDEALAAISHLRELIAAVTPGDDLTIRGTAPAAFCAYALRSDGIDPNALLLAAADTHKQLADLLRWANDVVEHDTDGAPDGDDL